MSRLANRFDEVLKRYFDLYRGTDALPPMIAKTCAGRLESPFQEKYWHEEGERYGLFGKLDECLMSAGRATPLDHKTSSSDPATKSILPAYQFQLDAYAFLLESAGKKTSGKGHLLFVYPEVGQRLHDGFPMKIVVETLSTTPQRAQERLRRAIAVYERPIPPPAPDCPFCLWYTSVKPFFEERRKRVRAKPQTDIGQRQLGFTDD